MLSIISGTPAAWAIGCDRLDVEDVDLRVAERLGIDQPGAVAQGCTEVVGLVGVDEGRLDAHLAQRDVELRVRAAIEQRRGHDVLARLHDRQDSRQLGRHAARGRERGAAVFQRRDALLQHRNGRIADARVDVAERLQVEEARRMIRRVEDIRRCLIDRHRAASGHRVWDLAGVQTQRFDAEGAVSHRVLLSTATASAACLK